MVLEYVSVGFISIHLITTDSPSGSRIPALSSHKVAAGLPVDAVGAAGAVGVGHVGASISPPGVVEAVVHSGRAGGASTLHQALGCLLHRSGKGACNGRSRQGEGREGDHVDCLALEDVQRRRSIVDGVCWKRETILLYSDWHRQCLVLGSLGGVQAWSWHADDHLCRKPRVRD